MVALFDQGGTASTTKTPATYSKLKQQFQTRKKSNNQRQEETARKERFEVVEFS